MRAAAPRERRRDARALVVVAGRHLAGVEVDRPFDTDAQVCA
jgi:hypothetical protein